MPWKTMRNRLWPAAIIIAAWMLTWVLASVVNVHADELPSATAQPPVSAQPPEPAQSAPVPVLDATPEAAPAPAEAAQPPVPESVAQTPPVGAPLAATQPPAPAPAETAPPAPAPTEVAQLSAPTQPAVKPQPTSLTSATLLVNSEEIGIVVTSAVQFPYHLQTINSPSQVIVDFPTALPDKILPPAKTAPGDVLVRSLHWSALKPTGTRLVLDLAYSVPNWQDSGWVAAPTSGYRLTIHASRRFVIAQDVSIGPGIKFGTQRRGELYGPVTLNTLGIWLREPGIRISMGLGKDKVLGLERVSSIVRRKGALAGVNATYFHNNGLPLGLIVDNGMLVSVPVYDRTAFIVLSDGSVGLDRAALRSHITLGDGSVHTVNGFNRTRKSVEIIVYNEAFGPSTPKSSTVRELVVRDGLVVGIGHGGTPLKPGVTVVAGDSNGKLKAVQINTHCRVSWELLLLGNKAVVPGERVRFAVSGGPRLVANGKVHVTSDEERFRADISQGRAPRTAVGITPEGVMLFVTVNGRQEGVSVGMTLEELASLMIELGAVDAMNFDGGGSTTMVVNDRVVNMPSDGSERAVSSALLVFAPRSSEKVATP